MVYFKSIIAGLSALLFAVVLIATIFLVTVRAMGIGIDMNLGSRFFWLSAIAVFSAGFLWEYRRLSK
jgi:hypothetical protein